MRSFIFIILTPLLLSGCGQREIPDPEMTQEQLEELELFTEAIRLVRERYVDVNKVQLDQIISNSLKGVVTSVDPYAELFYNGETEPPETPDDVAMIEAEGPDDHGLLILRVSGFNQRLRKELKQTGAALRKEPVTAILIDCRGSYGSDYKAAAMLAEWFLPRGKAIGSIEEHQGEKVHTFMSRKKPIWATNMVVIVQDNTLKGPGEFFAAALRANDRCVLVGQPSRGVAVIQTPVKLTEDWTVLLSTGHVREPGGRVIAGNPLVPDIIAQPEPENTENIDWSFLRALAVLKDQQVFREDTAE